AFSPGKHYAVPSLPNVTAVNSLGDFHIEADKLARYTDFVQSGGVHHWDENRLKNISEEPDKVRQIHTEMTEFVKVWLEGWRGGDVFPQQY
ncbi:hypothetical protein EI94DRAFT_1581555, partial [Lactarius quietus]